MPPCPASSSLLGEASQFSTCSAVTAPNVAPSSLALSRMPAGAGCRDRCISNSSSLQDTPPPASASSTRCHVAVLRHGRSAAPQQRPQPPCSPERTQQGIVIILQVRKAAGLGEGEHVSHALQRAAGRARPHALRRRSGQRGTSRSVKAAPAVAAPAQLRRRPSCLLDRPAAATSRRRRAAGPRPAPPNSPSPSQCTPRGWRRRRPASHCAAGPALPSRSSCCWCSRAPGNPAWQQGYGGFRG